MAKTITRRTAAKRTSKKESVASITPMTTPSMSVSPMKLSKRQISLAIGVIVVLGILYLLKGWFVVAMVNGRPISRLSLVSELEKQGGKQTLNTLITKSLIEQEAAKQHVTVSDADANEQIKKIQTNVEKQGQNLDQLLAAQGMTRASLMEQVKEQKLIEKMVGQNITVTDKEVDEYITTNKSAFPDGTDMNKIKGTIKEQLKQKKLNDKIQAFLDDLRKKAQITYFVNY